MTESFIVRALTVEDAEQRRELRLEALRTQPTAFGSTYAYEIELPRSQFERLPKDGLLAGAFDGERMVGMAAVVPFESASSKHWAHIYSMYVPADYWGRGVANKLMAMLLDYSRGRFQFIELSVTDGNRRALKFYQRHGFREFGRRARGMRHAGKDYDEILMCREVPA